VYGKKPISIFNIQNVQNPEQNVTMPIMLVNPKNSTL
jgi:hypothetical protein